MEADNIHENPFKYGFRGFFIPVDKETISYLSIFRVVFDLVIVKY